MFKYETLFTSQARREERHFQDLSVLKQSWNSQVASVLPMTGELGSVGGMCGAETKMVSRGQIINDIE